MKQPISRKQAYKIIWPRVRDMFPGVITQKELAHEFHKQLEDWGFEPPSLSTMDIQSLQSVMEIFNKDVEVCGDEKDRHIFIMRKVANNNGLGELYLSNLINAKWHKEYYRELTINQIKAIMAIMKKKQTKNK